MIGTIFATFFHNKISSSGIIQAKFNNEIEKLRDLKSISGNIASLQFDKLTNQTWIMAGKWHLQIPHGSQSSTATNFYANMTMTETTGISSFKLKLKDFKLVNYLINDTNGFFNGTATMSTKGDEGPSPLFNQTYPNTSISIKILSLKTIGLLVARNDIADHLGATPIFGTVSFMDSVAR